MSLYRYPGKGDFSGINTSTKKIKASTVNNPLDLFPSRNDTLSQAFFGVDRQLHKRRVEQSNRWLQLDSVDPNFGVPNSGHSNSPNRGLLESSGSYAENTISSGETNTDDLRRSYRRLQSSNIFNIPRNDDVNLSQIVPNLAGRANEGKKYIIVEESRLKELTKLEKVLQQERQLLGEQCTWILNDYNIKANIPIPATRLAIHHLCDSQMKKTLKDINELHSKWIEFSKANHYNKNHLFLKESYTKNAPSSIKALKLRLVREAADTWRLRKDRDTMLYEDDLSALNNKYQDALIRKKDYDRYFILATRYGPFSEEVFNLDPRPGRRYLMKASFAAIKFQHLWDRYWAMAKLRRYKNAKLIQKHARRFIVYKKLHPIIRMRMKIGKKTYYFFCWNKWMEYYLLSKNLRRITRHHQYKYVRKCFSSWLDFVLGDNIRKQDIIQCLFKRRLNGNLYQKFARWKKYYHHIKSVKMRAKRIFHFPHFDMWIRYTKWRKHVKRLHKAAMHIQTGMQSIISRMRHFKKVHAQKKLKEFAMIVLAIKKIRELRNSTIDAECTKWKPEELKSRANKMEEREKQRVNKRQIFVQDNEKIALSTLRKHLNSPAGELQLKDHVQYLSSKTEFRNNPEYAELPKVEKMKHAKKALYRQCIEINRINSIHDFNVKNPPFIQCPDPNCGATFSTEFQFHSHMETSVAHKGFEDTNTGETLDKSPSFTHFYLMLRHYKGQKCFRSYMLNTHGMSGPVNLIDAWMLLQEFKKTSTTHKSYNSKALNFFELYLSKSGSRRIDIEVANYEDIENRIIQVKTMEENSYFQVTSAGETNLFRRLFGLGAKTYDKWTDEAVIPPNLYDKVEWNCFLALFHYHQNNPGFNVSSEYQELQEQLHKEVVQRNLDLLADYSALRMENIRSWAMDFKHQQNLIYAEAMKVVNQCTSLLSEEIFHDLFDNEKKKVVFYRRNQKQIPFEEETLLADEAVSWAEIDILEGIYDFYVKSMLDTMVKIPELRKGMLEYSGLVKKQLRKRLVVKEYNANESKVTSESNDWFKQYFNKASAEEKRSIPYDRYQAAQRIQKIVRGIVARKAAKKLFVNTFGKHYDKTYEAYYYVNNKTGESSWERPKLTDRFFKNSSW